MPADNQAPDSNRQQLVAPSTAAGSRLDAVVATLFGDYSRSRLQDWIKRGFVTVDGQQRKTSDRLVGGEAIVLDLPPDATMDILRDGFNAGGASIEAQAMPIDLVHTDEQFFIVNKPVSLVMHPAPGNRDGTLMNGLLHLDEHLREVPRAGIVHRLDKDTSGLCVVARSLHAHTNLVQQLQNRTVSREYLAIAFGDVPDAGTVEEPIGRHPKDRKRMAVVKGGKFARTHFQVLERFDHCALVGVTLDTGRTHQIRVHMTHLGHPLLGDPVYSRRASAVPLWMQEHEHIGSFNRQALHAFKLGLEHPVTGRTCRFKAEPPNDFALVLQALRDRESV